MNTSLNTEGGAGGAIIAAASPRPQRRTDLITILYTLQDTLSGRILGPILPTRDPTDPIPLNPYAEPI